MKTQETNCRSCFPLGDQPQCRTFETGIGAIRTFNALFADNKMPMMCQGSDRHYRVCSQTADANSFSTARLLGDRIAERTA